MLAYAYLDEFRFGFNERRADRRPVARAVDAARKAVWFEPDNVRALQALMVTLFFDRDIQAAIDVGERALALNPNDPELAGEYGARIATAGDWNRGAALMQRVVSSNPTQANFYRGLLALAAYMQGNTGLAVQEIRQANLERLPIYQLIAAVIFADSGMASEAQSARASFLQSRPSFFQFIEEELSRRNLTSLRSGSLRRGRDQGGLSHPSRFSSRQTGRGDQPCGNSAGGPCPPPAARC
jgi:adenylate cyclase